LNKAVVQQRRALFDVSTFVRTSAEIQARADVRLTREALASNERARVKRARGGRSRH